MRFSRGQFALVLAGLASNALAWGGSDVTSAVTGAEALTPSTFQKFIESSEVVMVDFFAPWCGHCQRFAPKFDAAAKTVADAKLDAKLGKVDCTAYQGFCNTKGIRAYPTMKIYKQGKELYHEYTGPRRASSIVKFVEKQVLPVVTNITSKQGLDEFLRKETLETVLIGYMDDNDQLSRRAFSAAAEKLHEDFPLAIVSDPELVKYKGVAKAPSIVLYEPWEAGRVVFDGDFEVEAIKTFAKTAYTPLVAELNGDTFSAYTTKTPAAFLFAKSDDELKEWSAKLKPVAKTHKTRIAVANFDDFAPFASFLAVADDQSPTFAIYDPRSKHKFALDKPATVDNIARFMDDFVNDKLTPTIKSQPVPATQVGPVTIVVATTFKEIVMDPSKDVLIYYFSPTCAYCRALSPIWVQLGEWYKKHSLTDQLLVAAVDASANELEDKPMFVPSIKLYKAGDKSHPVPYNGNRSVRDLIQFVKDHGTHGPAIHPAVTPEEPVAKVESILHGQSPMHYGHDEL